MVLKIHFINSFGGACVVGNHDGAVAEGTFMILGDTAKWAQHLGTQSIQVILYEGQKLKIDAQGRIYRGGDAVCAPPQPLRVFAHLVILNSYFWQFF